MKNFFYRVRDSIYSPSFYAGLGDKPLSFSFKYFTLFVLILSFVATVFVGFRYAPSLKQFLAELGPQVIAHYPDELVIDVKQGEVSTNVIEPYSIPMPERLSLLFEKSGEDPPAHLLVIDTKRDFSLSQFRTYDALAWLTKNAVVYRSERGNVQITSLSEDTNEHVDQQSIVLIMENLKPAFAFAMPLFLVMSFFLAVVLSLLKLAYLFIGALFIYLLARVRKVQLSYKQAYQWGIHALTLPMILNLVFFFAGLSVPFLFTATLLFVAWFNLTPRGADAGVVPIA